MAFESRPGTPPEIRKYRRSTNLEPGKRFVHYGAADDLEGMRFEEKSFGISSDKGSCTAADLLNHSKNSELQRINMVKSEKVYKSSTREILGKTVDRGNVLPSKFSEGLAFGVASKSSLEPAKSIIFPTVTEESLQGDEFYIKSHGSYRPGEQKNRDYDWPVDPNQVRFGRKGDTIAFNGVSKNVADVLRSTEECSPAVNAKKVEDFRNMGDVVGQSRNLGQGSGTRPLDTVYGKPSAKPKKQQPSAIEVIRGKYSEEAQQPDSDLGKSITPGFRNIAVENRAFGCPSIRTDLPAGNKTRRSLADSQNYGDDVPARDLVNPPAFSDTSLPPTAMSEVRPKSKVLQLFAKIGQTSLEPQITEAIFDEASARSGQRGVSSSINAFRDCLNTFLEAQDSGREQQWRRAHGL